MPLSGANEVPSGGAIRGQVPEPAPAQLIGLGAIALGWMRRRRRRKD